VKEFGVELGEDVKSDDRRVTLIGDSAPYNRPEASAEAYIRVENLQEAVMAVV
jgi:hypothetical protein